MKIKLLVSCAGTGFVHNAGDEIEVSDAEARSMIESAQAIPVAAKKVIEKAVKK